MNDRKYVYIIEMCRWADSDNHSYCIGACSTLIKALNEGITHSVFRDRKYEPTIYLTEIDGNGNNKICTNLDEARMLFRDLTGSEWKENREEEII